MYQIIDTGNYHMNIIMIQSTWFNKKIRMLSFSDEEMSDTECRSRTAKEKSNATEKKKKEAVNYFFNDFSASDDEDMDNGSRKKKYSTAFNMPYYEELSKPSSKPVS